MTRWRAMHGFMVGVALLGLCSCGGSDDQAVAASPSTGAAATGAATSAPAATTEEAGEATGQSAELCAFLKEQVPGLKARGGGAAALANFTGSYSGWIEKD